jgi:hypothetical protein
MTGTLIVPGSTDDMPMCLGAGGGPAGQSFGNMCPFRLLPLTISV